MIRRSWCWALLALACSATAVSAQSKPAATAVHVLITAEEAKLPPLKGATAIDRRGITRGPRIDLVPEADPLHSPMHLLLKFEAFGGAKIVADSVKVTYVKNPAVDLTPRMKEFVQPTGIDMPDVQLPAGDHLIRVDLKDSDGRPGMTSFFLKIEP
jgi:hypothetical protein